MTGHGWLWPDSPHLFPALGGLLTGHVGAGLDTPDGLPSPASVVAAAVVIELALLFVTVWAARWFWTTAGPGRRLGMATRADAETALGAGRLRRVRKLIRPDLYGPASHARTEPPASSACIAAALRRPLPDAGVVGAAGTAASVADAVDAGIAAARVNRVRFSRPTSQRDEGPSGGPVHQAIVLTDFAGDAGRQSNSRFSPAQVGWRLGSGAVPRTGDLWVPFDRTAGVYRAAGIRQDPRPAHSGAAVAPGRGAGHADQGRGPAADPRPTRGAATAGRSSVLDPFGLAPGLPELVWDPVDGCVDSMVAERRAKAFTAGTVTGAVAQGTGRRRGPVLRRRRREGAAGATSTPPP